MPYRALLVVACAALTVTSGGQTSAQTDERPSFRSGVELVSVTAVVRDRRGRLVQELTRDDFRVLDGGEFRPIVNFWSDEAATVSVAVLLDTSGSMSVGSKMADARSSTDLLLARLRPGDESAVFVFDSELRELEPFTTERRHRGASLGDVQPYGVTSLYDAIAETAQRLAERPATHRAVVVISDGIDTHSKMTAPEVSAIASSIDVPVYLVATVSPLDLPDAPTSTTNLNASAGHLEDLARWTGGRVYYASAPGEASLATVELLTELRHQYVLAFEAAPEAGWRLIEVHVPGRTVRTRSAYQARARD
jgi:Ca-activated chloride channel family protein